ncbi:List-Bact-rpt repeat protein [Anaeroplasma bactoclasticum]|uniref:List-Bact-rpt repeat protein n=1 Tax=Anaeroplasma bactoclasticum TaxID=2088 RepID=A0A397RSJ1_9MOLU|nr:trypsin-like peptidase domain-containing protein [Anaeroplasma bactoclasticum]RIA75696.1 List-Bact-rpt repeat protein [Anaeroplasma bactoclasticum]
MRHKRKLLTAILALGFLSLTSCNINLLAKEENPVVTTSIIENTTADYTIPNPETKGDYKVSYVCNNGYTYTSITTAQNKILEPDTPTKTCATFKGWYIDKELTNLFDFSKAVHEDTILYAKWDIDLVSLVNQVSTDTIKANVRIFITNYDKTGYGPMATIRNASTALGSGVIFYEYGAYYYALTNNHVVYTTTTYQDLTLEDAYEEKYEFDIVAKDSQYDLSIIRFRKSNELTVLNLAKYGLEKNELVFAMGEPNGLSNTVSMGYSLGSKVFTPDEATIAMSNVTFSVYMSSAPIDSGSSGGALIDSNLNLVGINFASAIDQETNQFKYSYTIPENRVREFINSHLSFDI